MFPQTNSRQSSYAQFMSKIFVFFNSEFTDSLLRKHKQSLTELIRRDKNRPSVIMWSAANEPRTGNSAAGDYFQ